MTLFLLWCLQQGVKITQRTKSFEPSTDDAQNFLRAKYTLMYLPRTVLRTTTKITRNQ